MVDLVILSMHVKGFPQADFYAGHGEMESSEHEAIGASPDDFITLVRGATLDDAWNAAEKRWPSARIVNAIDDGEEDDLETGDHQF